MPLHLLGVSRSAEVCHIRGVDWVVLDSLAAAVTSLPPSPTPLEHAAHLAAIFRHGDILPMRFAAVLPDAEAVRNFLRVREELLLHDLERLRGTAEMGLRIELAASQPPVVGESSSATGGLSTRVPCGTAGQVSSGTSVPASGPHAAAATGNCTPSQYLAQRRTRYRSQDDLDCRAQQSAERYTGVLQNLARQWRRLSPEPPGTVRLAFLVQRNRSQAFAEGLAAMPVDPAGLHPTLLGPWPPYSFV